MKSGSTREKDDASFSLSRDVCYIMSKSGREIFSCLLLSVFREFLQMNCNVIESLWSCWRNRIEKERVPLPKFPQLVGYCRHRRFCCRWAIESCWLLVIATFLRTLEWFPSISLAIKSFGGLNEWEEERILAQFSREKNHKSDSDLHFAVIEEVRSFLWKENELKSLSHLGSFIICVFSLLPKNPMLSPERWYFSSTMNTMVTTKTMRI